MIKIKTLNNKKILILALPVLILSLAGAFYLTNQDNNSERASADPTSEESINYDPPTEEDAKRVEDNKQKVVERIEREKSQQHASDGNKKAVKPVITYAGQYGEAVEVGAFVSGVFEDNATCTTVFSKGTHQLSKSVQAVKNIDSMDCPVMSASGSEFPEKGLWSLVTKYDSPSASGESDKRQLEIK